MSESENPYAAPKPLGCRCHIQRNLFNTLGFAVGLLVGGVAPFLVVETIVSREQTKFEERLEGHRTKNAELYEKIWELQDSASNPDR